ncbi:hypothetical protein Tco_0312746 [Tanacetum coccineum]
MEDQPLPYDASPANLSPGYIADSDPEELPSNAEEPMEDQPLPDDASPTALSSGYVADSDPKEDPEKDHAYYPTDGGDVGDIEAFETDESAPTPPSPRSPQIVARLLALPTPPPSPLTPLSSPLPQIPSPPLPVSSPPLPLPSPPTTSPTYVEAPLGYKAAEIQMRVGESSAAAAARQPGPTLEAVLRRDRVREIGYGIIDTWDEIVEAIDRPYHCRTSMLLDREATYALRAWAGSEDRSAAIEAHVRTLEAQVATLMAQTSSLQTQLTTTLGRI